jgi:hypothetical protein
MKLQDTTTTIAQIGNVSNEAQFKMKTSRKAFQILSDLYSDKPLAIVRELGCNAADSMVMAGKADQPFYVHLPNALEPWLTIQDFGTGISHKNIYDIYSTYFESTKSNTNDQIGCLGLGSKSPFCYTDNFTITSIVDGEKRIYNSYFNQNNTPTIALMSTEETTEGNGIAIQIPIKAVDFHVFNVAVQKAFRFFDVKPTIEGGTINWNIEAPIFEGDGWLSYEKFTYGEAYAVMGGVTYQISTHHLESKHRDMINRAGLVLKFDMGELDFTPSRESLSYDEDTIKALNNKMEFIAKNFREKLVEIIDAKENIFDAIKSVNHIMEKFSFLGSSLTSTAITWNGMDITNPVAFLHSITKDGVVTHSRSTYSKKKYRESVYADISTKAKWYYDDLDKGTTSRVRYHLRNNIDAVLTIFTKKTYDALIAKGFPASLFSPTSDLAKAPSLPRAKGGTRNVVPVKGSFNVYTIGSWWHTTWEGKEFDPQNVPKYYIVKNTSDWNFSLEFEGLVPINDKSDVRTLADFIGISVNDICMVAPRNEKHLALVSTKLEDHVKKNYDFVIDPDDLATCQQNNISNFQDIQKKKAFKDLPSDNPFAMYINEVCKCADRIKKYTSILGKIKRDKSGKALKFDSKAYPLLSTLISKIGTYSWDNELMLEIVKNLK